MANLTEKQKIFANEYLVDFNATRSYKVAYSSCKKDETARVNGSKLLTNTNVKEYLDKRMKEREIRTEITQDKVLQELAAIAFSNGTDFAKVVEKPLMVNGSPVLDENGNQKTYKDVELEATSNLPKDKRKAISSIKETKHGISVESADKVKALELLGKHLGMFKEKVELTSISENINVDILDEELAEFEKEE